MGADFYQIQEKCPTCGHEEEYESIGITYNLSKMWYSMFPSDKNIVPIDGLTGQESESMLAFAIETMVKNEKKLRLFEPSNGWGSYESLLGSLKKMLYLAQKNPTLKWGMWR